MAKIVKALFSCERGEFREDDFIAVADRLGFFACRKPVCEDRLKPIAENYLPDIIGTNLRYALEEYQWETHAPLTKDGKTVSGFCDLQKG